MILKPCPHILLKTFQLSPLTFYLKLITVVFQDGIWRMMFQNITGSNYFIINLDQLRWGLSYFDLRKKALPDLSGIRTINSPFSLQNSSIAFLTPFQYQPE